MAVENSGVPVNNGTPTNDPASSSAGQSQTQSTTEAPSQTNLPENLKGKSPEQIAEMYVNLEKKLGEHSGELSSARKMKQEMDIVLQAIYRDPKIYREVERSIVELQGGSLPETRAGKGDGEAEKNTDKKGDSDVRISEQNRTIAEFETKFKINELSSEKRADLNKRIVHEFEEMVDPGGTKSIKQIISETPVHLLGKYLEKAYWLAQKESILSGESSSMDLASIGGMSSSSGKAESDDALSEHELKVASQLRVDPKKYAESKKKIRG